MASIKPEYLMQLADYKLWRRWSRAVDELTGESLQSADGKTEEEELLEEQVFEAVSKRAWTDLLLQVLKVSRCASKAQVRIPCRLSQHQKHLRWAEQYVFALICISL